MRLEKEKLAASLTNKFQSDQEILRQEVSLDVQTEINNRTKETELLKKILKRNSVILMIILTLCVSTCACQ
jgi:hypothetical protein